MTYYDLNLPLKGLEPLEDRVLHEEKLGYRVFAVSTEASRVEELEESLTLLLGEVESEKFPKKLKVYTRLNLRTGEVKFLKSTLRSFRSRVDLLTVAPESLQAFRIAGRDSRVDSIVVGSKNFKWLDDSQARLMKSSRVFLEVVLAEVLSLSMPLALRVLRRAVEFSSKKSIPMLLSLGAKSRFEAKHPRQLASLLKILGLEGGECKSVLTVTPRVLVGKSLHKKSSKHVFEGVDVVEG